MTEQAQPQMPLIFSLAVNLSCLKSNRSLPFSYLESECSCFIIQRNSP